MAYESSGENNFKLVSLNIYVFRYYCYTKTNFEKKLLFRDCCRMLHSKSGERHPRQFFKCTFIVIFQAVVFLPIFEE